MRNQKWLFGKMQNNEPSKSGQAEQKTEKKQTETEKQMPVKANVYGPSSFNVYVGLPAMR